MSLLQSLMGGVLLFAFFLSACSDEADSTPQFVFKPAPKEGVAAKVGGEEISLADVEKGIEVDIFELEKKLYELKYNKLKALMIEKMVAADPKAKGRNASEFLQEEVLKKATPTQKDIDQFIKERNIPKEHVNEQLLGRVRSFLGKELQEKATDRWLAKRSKKHEIEIYLTRPERPFFEVEVGDAPVMGNPKGKVTIVEFSDFECPYCSKGAEVVGEIKKKFGKKVRIAFKHFPLPFHKKAKGAANAAMCAHEQDKKAFWKLHDLMFERQSSLDAEGLEKMAKEIGLDVKKFQQCAKENKYGALVQKDIKQGQSIGVKSTPTFFINGRIINGAQPFEVFAEEIRQHL